ncbi:hypothetical protein LINGRAHAP2_LOCUS36278 [Linum grandiflorum]
MNHERCQ